MPAADGLSADMAHKAHIKAVNRDYILEPRLGELQQAMQPKRSMFLHGFSLRSPCCC